MRTLQLYFLPFLKHTFSLIRASVRVIVQCREEQRCLYLSNFYVFLWKTATSCGTALFQFFVGFIPEIRKYIRATAVYRCLLLLVAYSPVIYIEGLRNMDALSSQGLLLFFFYTQSLMTTNAAVRPDNVFDVCLVL